MKRIIFLFIGIFLMHGCSSETKTQRAIKEYLSRNLDDFDSYEPIEFGSVDSVFNNRYENMPDSESVLRDSIMAQKLVNDYTNNPDSLNKYTLILNEATQKLKEGTKDYKRTLIGLEQFHKFRAKNKLGGTAIHIGLFTLDTKLEKVIDFETY